MTGPMAGPADGRPRSGLVLVTAGTICGIAWAAGFRSYMSELAGTDSQIDWAGTFAAILLPGAVTGGLLGWAEHLRRSGGPRWARLVAGAALLAALTLATPAIGGARLALSEPRGAWVAVLVASFVVVLGLASAIPHLPVVRRSIEPG